MKRPSLARLGSQSFDVLIIGGGITGAAVARDAALRGLRVVLLEKDDFASGTSSKSTKLIHGGLRYLEHGDLRLVMEGCRERRLLLRNAAHAVRPQPFVIPVYDYDRRPPWMWRAGLWLYDIVAAFRNVARHKMLSPDEVERLEPNLGREHIRIGGLYYDAAMHDARLVIETLRSAVSAGALCVNYARVTALNRNSDGQLAGARVLEVMGGCEQDLATKVIINAGGPWADQCAAMSGGHNAPRLRLSKGVHLVTRKITNGHAVLATCKADGRILIIVPWLDYTLVGTTDTDYTGDPDQVQATPDDVAYLLEAARTIFPRANLSESDIISTMAGLRPLLDEPGKAPSDLSRTHKLICDEHGLISIVGGKYTTHRSMAAETVDHIVRQLGRGRENHVDTSTLRLAGCDVDDWAAFAAEARRRLSHAFGLSLETTDHLVGTYGVEVDRVVEPCRNEPWLAERLCPEHPHILAEAVWAFEHEMAHDAADFYFRRTSIGYGECGGRKCVDRLIEMLNRVGLPAARDQERFVARWQSERQRAVASLARDR